MTPSTKASLAARAVALRGGVVRGVDFLAGVLDRAVFAAMCNPYPSYARRAHRRGALGDGMNDPVSTSQMWGPTPSHNVGTGSFPRRPTHPVSQCGDGVIRSVV